MRIFNLHIFTKDNLYRLLSDTITDAMKASKQVDDETTWAAINPVLRDLEKLRANTWDQDKITHMQQWLKDHFEVKDDKVGDN